MIVYTVGTFDLLHVGHLALLNHCKSLGDIVAVGVASGVIAQSGVLASESSGDQIDFCYLNTVFELYSSYHFGQVVEAA